MDANSLIHPISSTCRRDPDEQGRKTHGVFVLSDGLATKPSVQAARPLRESLDPIASEDTQAHFRPGQWQSRISAQQKKIDKLHSETEMVLRAFFLLKCRLCAFRTFIDLHSVPLTAFKVSS